MSAVNADQQEFWSDQAGPVWVAQQAAMDKALQPVLDLLLTRAALAPGARVVDVGCGAGTSTLAAGRIVGPNGAVTGVDISGTLLAQAKGQAAGMPQVSFLRADAQTHVFEDGFDAMISRFGVMFFDDFTAAFTNMATALRPAGTVTFATWGPIPENPYFTLPARIAKRVIGEAPKTDPDAPGPFALRDAARGAYILAAAGMTDVAVDDVELMLTPEGDARTVAELMCEIGPAQRVLAHFDAGPAARADLVREIASALEAHATPEGIRLPARINLFRASKPA